MSCQFYWEDAGDVDVFVDIHDCCCIYVSTIHVYTCKNVISPLERIQRIYFLCFLLKGDIYNIISAS